MKSSGLLAGDATLREIGTIAGEDDAKVLADYLLTLDITTKLAKKADGSWSVWVHREDRVAEARRHFEEFALDPKNDRFREATREAKALRKKAEQAEAEHQKQSRDLREKWEGPLRRRAPLTFALLVLSLFAAFGTDLGRLDGQVERLSFSVEARDENGYRVDLGFANIRRGEVWRLVTPIFLHFGVLHLALNMSAFVSFGSRVEERKGTRGLALLVLTSAVVGNVAQFYASGGQFGGMSGVVFALAGYLWIKGEADPDDGLSLNSRTVSLMLTWMLMGFVGAEVPLPGPLAFFGHMANVAHAAGLVVGMLFGALKF